MRFNLYAATCIIMATFGQAITVESSDSYITEYADQASYDLSQTYAEADPKAKAKAEVQKVKAKAKVDKAKAKAATPAPAATPVVATPVVAGSTPVAAAAAPQDLHSAGGIAAAIKTAFNAAKPPVAAVKAEKDLKEIVKQTKKDPAKKKAEVVKKAQIKKEKV